MYFYILGALSVILIAGKIICKTAKYLPTRMQIRYSPTAVLPEH